MLSFEAFMNLEKEEGPKERFEKLCHRIENNKTGSTLDLSQHLRPPFDDAVDVIRDDQIKKISSLLSNNSSIKSFLPVIANHKLKHSVGIVNLRQKPLDYQVKLLYSRKIWIR